MYNPYGSFTYDVVVKSISPKGRCIKVGNTNYYPIRKDYAEAALLCWGRSTIEIIYNS